MQKPGFDPGLTQEFAGPLRRAINKDGSFNVQRRGGTWRDAHPYFRLINMRWPLFLVTLFSGYVAINTLFAVAYFAIGTDQLTGIDAPTVAGRFLETFFFSAHTLSTVGYGNISPHGVGAESVSSLEALVGVLGFALATGLLFGRVSRPSARIGFSENMLIAPYREGLSLQFRVVNRRPNSLVELEARVMLMTVEMDSGQPRRHYEQLRLERDGVLFLPLTWTVVHPIDADSPLWEKTPGELARLQAEALILIKAYDDSFSQSVVVRYSYRHDEMVWGRNFTPAFFVDAGGDLVVDLQKVGETA
jgi:inward rectifier potassium channel